jgi:hypothetical protein
MTSFPETDRHLAGGVAGNGSRRAEEQEGEVVGLNDVGGGFFFFGMMLVVVDRGGLPYWSGSGLSTHTLEAQYDKPN